MSSIRRFQRGTGQWSNQEDEILKAGVAKYGILAWEHVSSLLEHRRTAAQCQRRWEEYLCPAVKHAEWNRDEEDLLLKFAGAFPDKWQLICEQIPGRTATMCQEHYAELKDRAEHGGETSEQFKLKRKEEMELFPESKPARADATNLDSYQEQAMDEARTRLANTQGKKGNRKSRLRQLQEAETIAALQKARVFREAGMASQKLNKKDKRLVEFEESIVKMAAPAPSRSTEAEGEAGDGEKEFVPVSIDEVMAPLGRAKPKQKAQKVAEKHEREEEDGEQQQKGEKNKRLASEKAKRKIGGIVEETERIEDANLDFYVSAQAPTLPTPSSSASGAAAATTTGTAKTHGFSFDALAAIPAPKHEQQQQAKKPPQQQQEQQEEVATASLFAALPAATAKAAPSSAQPTTTATTTTTTSATLRELQQNKKKSVYANPLQDASVTTSTKSLPCPSFSAPTSNTTSNKKRKHQHHKNNTNTLSAPKAKEALESLVQNYLFQNVADKKQQQEQTTGGGVGSDVAMVRLAVAEEMVRLEALKLLLHDTFKQTEQNNTSSTQDALLSAAVVKEFSKGANTTVAAQLVADVDRAPAPLYDVYIQEAKRLVEEEQKKQVNQQTTTTAAVGTAFPLATPPFSDVFLAPSSSSSSAEEKLRSTAEDKSNPHRLAAAKATLRRVETYAAKLLANNESRFGDKTEKLRELEGRIGTACKTLEVLQRQLGVYTRLCDEEAREQAKELRTAKGEEEEEEEVPEKEKVTKKKKTQANSVEDMD